MVLRHKININPQADKINHVLQNVTVNTFADKANYIVHKAALATIAAAAALYVGTPEFTIYSIISSIISMRAISRATDELHNELTETKPSELPRGSKRLPIIIKTMSNKLGLMETPSLHTYETEKNTPFSYDNDDASENESGAKKTSHVLKQIFQHYANACAIGCSKHDILLSGPLLDILNEPEEAGVLAHELGHVAAAHTEKKIVTNAIAETALINTALSLSESLVSWKGLAIIGASLVTGIVTGVAIYRSYDSDNDDISEKLTTSIKSGITAGTGVMLSTSVYFGMPEVLGAWLAMKTTTTASKLVQANYSRRTEFQADRISAETTGDPASLCSALRKIGSYNINLDPEACAKKEYNEGSLPVRIFRRAKTLFREHPNDERRCNRLAKKSRHLPPPPSLFGTQTLIEKLRCSLGA